MVVLALGVAALRNLTPAGSILRLLRENSNELQQFYQDARTKIKLDAGGKTKYWSDQHPDLLKLKADMHENDQWILHAEDHHDEYGRTLLVYEISLACLGTMQWAYGDLALKYVRSLF